MSLKPHLLFLILLIILAIYFGFKITQENGWSGWGFGSAQVYMGAKYWAEDGMLAHKFLLLPMGYSKLVQYLDNPDMRHQARGTTTGGLIGSRLYYTHYPNFYIIPYALLMKMGVYNIVWHRLLSVGLSLSAMTLFYIFFNLLVKSPIISFWAIFYYAISVMFLDYADTMCNQPFDDLFRAAILIISLAAIYNHKKIYNYLIWILYFLLSILSYDSTFFIFIWLIGLDIITSWLRKSVIPDSVGDPGEINLDSRLRGNDNDILKIIFRNIKNLPWKKWLFFASAPILAFALQMLQNYWYLGWPDIWLDLKGSFLFRSNDGPGVNFLEKHIRSMFSPLVYLTAIRVRFIIPLILILIIGFIWFKKRIAGYWPDLKYLFILMLAGLAYALIFVSSGYFPYQGRQLMPFLALLVGSATVLVLTVFKTPAIMDKIKNSRLIYIFFVVFAGALIMLWSARIWETAGFLKGWPDRFTNKQTISFYKSLNDLTANEAVIFNLDNSLNADYQAPNPIEEYYAGRLILNFKNFQDFMRDYLWLNKYSKYPFDAIIISPQKELAEGVAALWSSPDNVKLIEGKYVLYLPYKSQ